MAFLAERPISITRPIWTKTSFSLACGATSLSSYSDAERAEHGDRGAQQDAERERPALVLCRENQKHEEQGKSEDDTGRHAFCRHLLLEGHARYSRSPSRRAWLSLNTSSSACIAWPEL